VVTIKTIHFHDVSFQYSNEVKALDTISLSIQSGERVGIMGRNGAGKSTLIHLLNGLLLPTKGEVFIDGIPTTKFNPTLLTQKIGVMFQNPEHQLFSSTVEEEIDFSLKSLKISNEERVSYKQSIIEELKLHTLLHKSPWNCSGGERKKISIASILCRQPEVLVFDEPTLGQDKNGYQILDSILSKAKDKKQTLIVVTHNTDFAFKNLNRIIVLDQGRILADGPTQEILTNKIIQHNSAIVEPQFFTFKSLLLEKLPAHHRLYQAINNATNFEELQTVLLKTSAEGA